MKLTDGDKAVIRRIVGSMHCSSTDQQVTTRIQRKLPKTRNTEEQRTAAVAYALEVHHENQKVWRMFR